MNREEQLIHILAMLIEENKPRSGHGEDTIGVLLKAGAFHFLDDPDGDVVELARKIESATFRGERICGAKDPVCAPKIERMKEEA